MTKEDNQINRKERKDKAWKRTKYGTCFFYDKRIPEKSFKTDKMIQGEKGGEFV